MGRVHPGVPEALVVFLKQRFDLRCFVETGTYLGDSASWAAKVFPDVYSIEASEQLWHSARRRHSRLRNVHFILGDSPRELATLIPTLSRPLFWLDAHWSGGATAGQQAECPLLQELAVLAAARLPEPFILIDDARLFLEPPPPPHQREHWPDFSQVTAALGACGEPFISVVDDVIVAVPQRARADLVALGRQAAGAPRHSAGPPPVLEATAGPPKQR